MSGFHIPKDPIQSTKPCHCRCEDSKKGKNYQIMPEDKKPKKEDGYDEVRQWSFLPGPRYRKDTT